MPKKRIKHPRLVDRDYEILEHIARYRLTTREVLHRLFFTDSEVNAVTKVTSRLVENRFLNRFDLHSGKSYFVFAPNSARLLGISLKKTNALGPQALVQNYGILQFCCLSEHPRERLLVQELAQRFTDLRGKHLRAGSFYIDSQSGETRLASIRVDHGGPSAHVVRKCRGDLESIVSNKAIAGLINEQRFMFAIITANEQKVSDIQEALKRQTWPVQFRVEAVPDLGPLLFMRNQFTGLEESATPDTQTEQPPSTIEGASE